MTDVEHQPIDSGVQQQQQQQHQQQQYMASDKRLAAHLRVRKTQARPGRTLFGSVLERLSDEDIGRLPECDSAEARGAYSDYWKPKIRERPAPQQLPAELAAFLRERHAPGIARHSQEVDEWRQRLQVRERRLNLLERDAKYVFDLPHPVEQLPHAAHGNYGPRPRWMTVGDLRHADEVNPQFMGPGVRNFNRDKYRRLPDSHSYALVGDPMRPGMDFDCAPVEMALPQPQHPLNARPDRLVVTPRTEKRQLAMRRLPPSTQMVNGVEIPMRLVHQFGADVCQNLLSNQEAVLDTSRRMQTQRDRRAGAQKPPSGEAPAVTASHLEAGDPNYELLGNALRTNVFGRGYSVNQRLSSNHEDFSRAQFDKREPVPDQYRCQKDHVSRWAEANVLEMRMKRALQDRMDRMLHKKTAEG